MSKTIGAMLVLLAIAGCGSNDMSSVSVNNMNPLGTVGGVVVDAATEMPINGATVTVVSGGTTVTAMTNGDGVYSLAKVPAGSFTMTIAQKGYQAALVNDELAGNVGNFPVTNPTHTVKQVGLVADTGSFGVKLVDDNGNPVPMIKLTATTSVREVLYTNGQPVGTGSYAVSATTDMDGNASFMGLPVYAPLSGLVDDTVVVAVPPILSMGTYTFLGLQVPFHLNALVAGQNGFVQTINVVGPTAPLTVVDSNIAYLKGKSGPNATTAFTAPTGSVLAVGGPITIAFNQAINGGSLRASILDENGMPVATTVTPTVNTNLLSLTVSPALSPGVRYNLVLHAVAATAPGPQSAASELDVSAPFFTAPPSGSSVKLVSAKLSATMTQQLVQLTFSEPVGFGLGSTSNIDCAAFYEVPASTGFNNDSSTVFQGDWKTTSGGTTPPANLVCHLPLNVPGGPYLDVTMLQPLESTNSSTTVITGFSDRWQIQVDTISAMPTPMSGPCDNGIACTKIGIGTNIHLIFSRQTGIGVKRTDGTPVPDNLTAMITQ